MRRLLGTFTLRSMMVLVALVALNLGAGLATSGYYPRRQIQVGGQGMGLKTILFLEDGSILWGIEQPWAGTREVTLLVRRPLWPNLPQIWAPVVGSVSITLLVLLVPLAGARSRSRSASTSPDGHPANGTPRFLTAARWATVGAALIALNVSAAIFPAPVDCYDTEASDLPFVVLRDITHRKHHGTAVYRTDGSVISYEGRPGQILSRPTVIRPPMYSPLRMWGPVLVSSTITAYVLVLLRGQWKSRELGASMAPMQ